MVGSKDERGGEMKVVRLDDCINEIKSLDNCGVITRSTNHICEDMRKEVKEFDAIPISEGSTREQVFKEVFGIEMMMAGLKNMDWWNAPYKKEVEE